MNNLYKYRFLIIFVSILALAGFTGVYRHFAYRYVTIEFKEMRPFHRHPAVYYKGIKIGRALTIRHNDTFTHSLVKIVLYPHNLKLPQNITAKLKKEKRKRHEFDYIELIYPEAPSRVWLQNGDTIKGTTTIDIESFIANQDPETMEKIKDDIARTVTDLDSTINALGDLFVVIQEMVDENRPNLKTATGNMAKMSSNLNQTTFKFNTALKQEQLDNTFSNINSTTLNIKTATASLGGITANIDNVSGHTSAAMPEIGAAITNGNCVLENLCSITSGIKNTLKKPFGGLRILFGKSIPRK